MLPFERRDLKLLWLLVTLRIALSLATHRGYGIFRDELYYLACAEHLDWGYVDHPPLIAVLTWLSRAIGGDSLLAIRFAPALLGGATVLAAGLVCRALGGGRAALILTCVSVACAPVLLSFSHFNSMNVVEPVLWTLGAFVLVRLADGARLQLWLVFGMICGLGLLNKHSMLFFGFASTVALFALPSLRSGLRTRWPWLGFGLAFAIFLPNLLWQVRHDFPTLEFMDNARAHKNLAMSPLAFLKEQLLQQGPLAAPLWIGGIVFSLRGGPSHTRARPLAVVYLTLLAVFLATQAKPYYLAGAYPMLFAAGSVACERLGRKLVLASFSLTLLGGAALLPLAVPVLTEERYVAYVSVLGIAPGAAERHELGPLPQFFADMHGWRALTRDVARVFHALPADEQRTCAIYANNYGEAGAIDFFGPALGLPKAIASHNAYWMWGPREASGECLIVIGGEREDHLRFFESVEAAGDSRGPWRMPFENVTLWLLRGPRENLAEVWPRLKRYI
jgi:hypothetical protein